VPAITAKPGGLLGLEEHFTWRVRRVAEKKYFG
jgi:hypothetical protein